MPNQDSEAARHSPVDDVILRTAMSVRPLRLQDAEVVAVEGLTLAALVASHLRVGKERTGRAGRLTFGHRPIESVLGPRLTAVEAAQ